jgi:hypothetical protein
MRLEEALAPLLPTAAMKSVSLPEPSSLAVSPEILTYVLFGALLLIIFYVFSRR